MNESGTQEKLVVIDYEARSRSLVTCLHQAFEAAQWPWSRDFLNAYIGLAFVFSMKEDGGGVWHVENYEWSYFPEVLESLGDNIEMFSSKLKGKNPDSPEEYLKAKKNAWDAVRVAIDSGLPPIVWQPMGKEIMKTKRVDMLYAREWALPRRGQRPYLWSLITGYDESTQRYLVDSEASYGKFAIGWDAFGTSDPVNWFCVMIIKPHTKPFNAYAAHRLVIQRAVEASQGMRPANTGEAKAHGLAAWELWLESLRERSRVSMVFAREHASFLRSYRKAAAIYLSEIEQHFPEGTRFHLRAAAEHYDAISEEMTKLRDLDDEDALDVDSCTELVSQAFQHENEALAELQVVLDSG